MFYMLLLLFPLTFLLIRSGAASTYYVAVNGDDGANGAKGHPWRTLAHALGSLLPGDDLYVHGGVYSERITDVAIHPGTPSQPILVKACQGEKPVVKGLLWLKEPSYWMIDGLNVTWDDDTGRHKEHMVKLTNGIGWTFENAELSGARSYAALLIAGTKPEEPSNWKVAGNCIHDTHRANAPNQDQLIYVNTGIDGGPGVIEHNLLYSAENGEGIKLGGSKITGGAANVTICYNTIYGAVQSILVAGGSHDNIIYGNILGKARKNYGCIRGFRLTGVGNQAFDNDCVEADRLILNDRGYGGIEDRGGNRLTGEEGIVAALHRLGSPGVNRAAIPIGVAGVSAGDRRQVR